MAQKIIIALLVFFLLAGVASAAEGGKYTRNVAIVLYSGVEILDFAGPTEVFAAASGFGRNGEERAFNVYTVSRTKAPIVSQGIVDIIPDYSIDDAPKPDIIVLPGGGAESVIKDAVWLEWVRKSAAEGEHVLTVCTGAFIAGKIGMLDGAEATTWYNAIPGLTKEFPNAKVIPGRRFIDNGKLITTAGVSAGIDGSLHLVARLLGRYVADRTAEYMEYKWSPESYHSARYPNLNPTLDRRGKAMQQATISMREGDTESAITAYRALLAENKNDADAWLGLGRVLHAQKRYAEATPAFQEAAKAEKIRGNALYNLSCALALAGQRDKAIDAAAKAIEAGFKTKWYYENDEDLKAVRDDPRFQALLTKL